MKKSLKEDFLKQIEEYNDFIIQNDLDVDKIDPDHDYDFLAFKTPEDYAIESERLSDRLSDRKIEIAHNDNNDDLQGLEIENGMPSYKAVKGMTDEQFEKYEDKYLLGTFKEIDEQIKVDEARPEFEQELKEEIIRQDHQRNGEPYVRKEPIVVSPLDQNKTVPIETTPLDNNKEYEFSLPVAWELVKGTHPGIQNTVDAVNSVGKVIYQGQPVNAIQDAGRGVMSGLADTTGSILDVGGLLPNSIADVAHDSSDWWKNQYEIVDSEAGNIGTNIGTEAVTGALGGVVGKTLGVGYKALKESGEVLRKRATTLSKDTEKRVRLDPTFRKNVEDRMWKEQHTFDSPYKAKSFKRIKEGSLDDNVNREAAMIRQDSYENLTNKSPYMPLNSRESLGSVLFHNVKRKLDARAMLEKNDNELNQLFSQGIPLDQAVMLQRERWSRYPNVSRDVGMILGTAVGQ